MLYYEFLKLSETVNAEHYCRQLNDLIEKIEEKDHLLIEEIGKSFCYTVTLGRITQQTIFNLG